VSLAGHLISRGPTGLIVRSFMILLILVETVPAPAVARDVAQVRWLPAQAENLASWIESASGEGLELSDNSGDQVRSAIGQRDTAQLDKVAGEAAMTLLRAWRGRCCSEKRPGWWHIDGAISDEKLEQGLADALSSNTLDAFLRSIRPGHPHYQALVDELARESNADRQKVLRANLARWRWVPARLGDRYLLVNIASQYLTLWDKGRVLGRWRVIIGNPSSRTPVFTTNVSGVVLNPWWEIPPSIAAEGIASFVRRSPAAARARGYIYQNGRYRQMPGDNNALGRMKLIMPNPYSVLIHDTSKRELFARDCRALSHGCIRVDRALSFASRLLVRDGWTQERVEAEVAKDATRRVVMSKPMPLYVTYFTAERAPSGEVRYYEDIYRRDPIVLPAQAKAGTDIYGSSLGTGSGICTSVTGAARCPS